MVINKGGYLEANLWAFVMYNSILSTTDIQALYNYFGQQHSGYANLQTLLAKQAASAAASATNNTNNISTLEDQLAQCKNITNKLQSRKHLDVVKTPPKPNWSTIRAGAAQYTEISDSELEQCSPLEVNPFGSMQSSKTIANILSQSNVAPIYNKISYPKDITSSLPKVPVPTKPIAPIVPIVPIASTRATTSTTSADTPSIFDSIKNSFTNLF